MKIMLVQHDSFLNGSGGTEKICAFIANTLAEAGHHVTIAVNQAEDGKPVFPLAQSVTIKNIHDSHLKQIQPLPLNNYNGKNPLKWLVAKWDKKKRKLKNWITTVSRGQNWDEIGLQNLEVRAKHWKSFIDQENPDVIITMSIASLVEITYNNEYDIPIIDSINGRPDYDYTDLLWYRSPTELNNLRAAFAKLTGAQVLFENYKDFLPENFSGMAMTISNPLPQLTADELAMHTDRKKRFKIVNLATLNLSCKQQDVAVELFAELADDFPQWDLEFWGEGQDKRKLEELIQKKNLNRRVFIRGFTHDPLEIFKKADIFLFPSKYEGFGLALGEAMASGLPSLGFKSCSGVNQLITHDISGYLATDVLEMKRYLRKLMESSDLRKEMGKNGNAFTKGFDQQLIAAKWIDFIEKVKGVNE